MLSSRIKTLKHIFESIRWILERFPIWVAIIVILGGLANLSLVLLGGLPGWIITFIDTLSNFSAVFLGIFIEAVPFLLLGTLASGIVDVFIDREELVRWVPRRTLPGVLAGSLIGLAFPVCECGVVPFTRRLIRKGVPVSIGITTLLAAPVINPIVIASTLAAFGPGLIFWGRIGLTFLIAVITGLIISSQKPPDDLIREVGNEKFHGAVIFPVPEDHSVKRITQESFLPKKSFNDKISRVLLIAVDEFFEMGRYLVLGALLATILQTFVRQPILLSLAQGPVLSVVSMVFLAVLLSVCSTVDAFIALAFTGTFSNGSILAFLVFGPMVDIKSTLMFLSVFKTRLVVYLISIPLLLTMILTILINSFGRGW